MSPVKKGGKGQLQKLNLNGSNQGELDQNNI